MQKLLVKIAIFAGANLLAGWGIVSNLVEVPTTATYKRAIIEKNLDADTLVLGSSHAVFDVAPLVMPGHVVNLANVSQDLYYDCELARRYLGRMPRLRRILLEISFFSWERSLGESEEKWRGDLYVHAFGIYPQKWTFRTGHYSQWAAFGWERVLGVRRESDPFDSRGWLRGEGRVDCATGKVAARRHLDSMREAILPTNLELVRALIGACRTRAIDVVLVTPPAHECYRRELDAAAIARTTAATESMRREFGVRHLDYFTDGRFDDADFFDGDHLNAYGAEKFSRILAADLDIAPSPAGKVPRIASGVRGAGERAVR
jgi:hypothetical protein